MRPGRGAFKLVLPLLAVCLAGAPPSAGAAGGAGGGITPPLTMEEIEVRGGRGMPERLHVPAPPDLFRTAPVPLDLFREDLVRPIPPHELPREEPHLPGGDHGKDRD
jgi:hypothetical protein